MPSYTSWRRPNFIGHFVDGVHHEPDAVRARTYRNCLNCQNQRQNWSVMLRRDRRIIRQRMVQCEHSWSACLHRDDLDLIPADIAEYCEECGGHFCPQHHHSDPSVAGRQNCERHGRVARCLEVYRCDDCENYYCDNCHSNGHECSGLDDWGSSDNRGFEMGRPVQLLFAGEAGSHPQAMGARYIGFELEVEEGTYCEIPSEFGIEEDGSIQGIEVLTPPARGSYFVHQTRQIMRTLREAGWEGTEACGMHTHIDLRDKREDMVFLSRLFAVAYATEDMLYSTQHLDRHQSTYSIPLRQSYSFFDGYGLKATDFEFAYNKMDKSLENSDRLKDQRRSKWGNNRYYGFNFHSVFHRGTLEVRIHEGCLDPEQALLWAELLQALVARVEKGVNYRILQRLLEMEPTPQKVKAMKRYFSLSDEVYQWLLGHINRRLARGRAVRLPYTLGTPRRGKSPSLTALQRRIEERLPTHWSCGECNHMVPVPVDVRRGSTHPSWCGIYDMLLQRPGFPYMARLHHLDGNGVIHSIGNARRVLGSAGRSRQGRFIVEQMSMWDRWAPPPPIVIEDLDDQNPWFMPSGALAFESSIPNVDVIAPIPARIVDTDIFGNPVSLNESEF